MDGTLVKRALWGLVLCAAAWGQDFDLVLAMEPRSGKYEDKAMAALTEHSEFNVLGWRM